jgi:hypothetical protein
LGFGVEGFEVQGRGEEVGTNTHLLGHPRYKNAPFQRFPIKNTPFQTFQNAPALQSEDGKAENENQGFQLKAKARIWP